MPRRSNGWLIASALLGASYWAVAGLPAHGPWPIVWKGSGVALLAIAALVFAKCYPAARRDAGMLAAALALGAAGDVGIEFTLTAGAASFLAGHAVAIWLYTRNRSLTASTADRLVALSILVLVPVTAWLLPLDRQTASTVALYAAGLAAMAASAWLSRFPRERVALGALLFVASDLLIFARMGPLAGSLIPRLLVWPLYFGGQFLICTGVLTDLSRRSAA